MSNFMTIGEAVILLKQGHVVARKGWNGQGMFLFLVENKKLLGPQKNIYLSGLHGHRIESYVMMKTADNKIIPWLCSQADLLAEDWVEIVPQIEEDKSQTMRRLDD